jgi:hypothetical protein
MFSFCWEEMEPSEECLRFYDEDNACWNEVWVCQDEAYATCYPPEPDPCEWVFEVCASGSMELPPEECDALLAECGPGPEEPPVAPCEEELERCLVEGVPAEECEALYTGCLERGF